MNLFRRLAMAILFCLALLVTWSGVTNMTFTDVRVWAESSKEKNKEEDLDTHEFRMAKVQEKVLEVAEAASLYLSNEEIIGQTLEEYILKRNHPTHQVMATGYTAGVESTGKSPGHPQYGITFSGVNVTRDLYSTIAADPEVFPIGTILYIPDYGYGVVADTGSAIKGDKIDLYYETVDDVFKHWGKKETDVYVVKWGEGKLSEEELLSLNEAETMQVFREQWQNNS